MSVTLVNPYCTRAELQGDLKNTDAAIYDELDRAINDASRYVDRWTGKDFIKHDYSTTVLTIDDFMDCVFGNTVFLPYYPINTLTEVKLDGVLLVADTDYHARTDTGELISLEGDWAISRPDNLLTFKGILGYAQAATTDVPTGLPAHVNLATRLIACALCGHNRKQVAGLDGQLVDITDRTMPIARLKELIGPGGGKFRI